MNGPTLRIGRTSRFGPSVSKKASYFAPVQLEISSERGKHSTFVTAQTVEHQLTCTKEILQVYKKTPATDTVDFLAQVFLEAPLKHPVKCFLARHVTKNSSLQKPFADSLSKHILKYTTNKHNSYCNYTDEVTKLMACIENFPAGVAAFKLVEMELAWYLINCANTCILSLSSSYTDLSVTKKNEVLELAHLTLRLLLYVVQKLNQSDDGSTRLNQSEDGSTIILNQSENGTQSEDGSAKLDQSENSYAKNHSEDRSAKLNSISKDLMTVIKHLLVNEDLPMDAKSVAGILLLTMYLTQNDSNDWKNILCDSNKDKNINELMKNPLVRLSLYSAIVNVVPMNEIKIYTVIYDKEKTRAIIALARHLIDMTNLYATESVIVLGVSRTLLQLSKMLHKLTWDKGSGALFAHLWAYVQEHLNHHMDSVQHLSSQTLDSLVVSAVSQCKKGNPTPLDTLIADTNEMPWSTKAPFVSLTALSKQLSAGAMLDKMPSLISKLLEELPAQATQASVTTLMEILLKKHCQETSAEEIDRKWIEPTIRHVAQLNTYDTNTISIVNNLIAKAVDVQPGLMHILLERIKQLIKSTQEKDPTSHIMALLNGVKKAGGVLCVAEEIEGYWKGLVKYELLERSAVDIDDKARHLSLSLIVESPKTTEGFTRDELKFVLFYLKYNINEQSPHFRQLTLSLLKKFMKRLMTSYTALKRQTHSKWNVDQFYLDFVDDLREFCFDGLFEGANYSRRCIALQLLVWCDHFKLDGYESLWKEKFVERLLLHLEDTYETNKKFALEILNGCPPKLLKLKTYSISLEVKDIFEQASLLKPTECVSASYKLVLMKRKLPEAVREVDETYDSDVPEIDTYILIQALLNIEASQFENWNNGLGAASSPLYGIFRCIRALLADVDYSLIRSSNQWRCLILSVIRRSQAATTLVSAVVNDSSPEGYLPMDFTQCNTDDSPVTAQMVLLSAWRTVKECSLLLGEIFTNCSERDSNNPDGALTLADFYDASRYFMSLLEQTQHRGAFEQAYIGFTMLLRRMWQSKNIELCSKPRAMLDLVLRQIRGAETSECVDQSGTMDKSGDVGRSGDLEQSGDVKRNGAGDSAQPTRRSAGLPLIVQAILMTELEVDANSPHIQTVFDELISMAQNSIEVTSRVHAMNVLRALYRSTALAGCAGARAGRGVALVLRRFHSKHWAERNSATLLFSSLMVRMFGVQRERERICVRNRMTGRIFFLKYPMLYDTLLKHLKEACESDSVSSLHPSLYPALLLLSRLYPSSLEGTASHYKLSSLVPLVQRCARAAGERVRRAAAAALHALRAHNTSPETHIHELLDLLQDRGMKRNYCHGILLQLNELLADTPKEKFLSIDPIQMSSLMDKLNASQWILEQLIGERPCFIIADEYFKVLFYFVETEKWLETKSLKSSAVRIHTYNREELSERLRQVLANKTSPIFAGREICLSNAVYKYLRLYHDIGDWNEYVEFIEMCLRHSEYDIVLSALNYLLEAFENKEFTQSFQELPSFTQSLKHVYLHSKYPLCVNLSLQVLIIHISKTPCIIELVTGKQHLTNQTLIEKLIKLMRKEEKPDIYFEMLSDYIDLLGTEMFVGSMFDIAGVLFEYSTADNDTTTRLLVAKCLEIHGRKLTTIFAMSGPQRDEYYIYLWCTYIVLLLDEDVLIRESICRASNFADDGRPVMISTKTMELLLPRILCHKNDDFNLLMLTVVALLDFKSEVYMNEDDSDEGRVFDQSERHNIFAEELIITNWAAEQIKAMTKYPTIEEKLRILNKAHYLQIITKLCNDHFVQFKTMVSQRMVHKNVNPKVSAFYMKIK